MQVFGPPYREVAALAMAQLAAGGVSLAANATWPAIAPGAAALALVDWAGRRQPPAQGAGFRHGLGGRL